LFLQLSLVFPIERLLQQPWRSRRFPLHLPVRYRPVGEEAWHKGRTENISGSGVLFRAEALMSVATPLEIAFELPIGARAPVVFCVGRVVRTVLAAGADEQPAVAATISEYRFVQSRA
jgi:hypothetical protein